MYAGACLPSEGVSLNQIQIDNFRELFGMQTNNKTTSSGE